MTQTIYTDAMMIQGDTHKLCEDYVLTGTSPFPFLLVADGCSSSELTDVGARILLHTAKQVVNSTELDILWQMDAKAIGKLILSRTNMPLASMRLNRRALDATLLIAIVNPALQQVRVMVMGDGLVIYKNESGLNTVNVEAPNNAPFYPNFLQSANLSGSEQDQYLEGITESLLVETFLNGNKIDCQTVPPTRYFDELISMDGLQWLLLSTDGLTQIKDSTRATVPLSEVITSLTGFNSLAGEFVTRRMKRWQKRQLPKSQWTNSDDLGIAGLSIMEVPDE